MRLFGITAEQYEAIFEAQNRCCKLCGEPIEEIMGRKPDSGQADHNHETGQFRGIIHKRCNNVLGWAQDSTERLQKAIDYLAISRVS